MKEMFDDLINGRSPRFVLWIFPLVSLFVLIAVPWIVTRKVLFDSMAYNETGQIGDTIGGTAGPIIALIASLLTFFAFWVQFRSNQAQTAQFNKQDNDTKVDRFENRFYELLALHRENVTEMSVGKFRSGRRVFLSMYDEFRFSYYTVKLTHDYCLESKQIEKEMTPDDLINVSYLLFFLGVGESSQKMTQDLLKNYPQLFVKLCEEGLLDKQKEHKQKKEISVFTERKNGREHSFKLKLSYSPFNGHMSRLGHYYRHLFQTVKFVVEQPNDLPIDKYEYLKTLRAQLSSHEQVLLYYNSFTKMGSAWTRSHFFTEYRFIKNIPLPLADIGKGPKEKLGERNSKGELLFEWDEFSN